MVGGLVMSWLVGYVSRLSEMDVKLPVPTWYHPNNQPLPMNGLSSWRRQSLDISLPSQSLVFPRCTCQTQFSLWFISTYDHFISSQFKLSLWLNPSLISFSFQCELLPFWLHFDIISISTFLGQFHFNLRSNLLFWFSKQFPHLLIFQSKALWYFSSNLRNLKSEVNVKSCEKSVLTVSQSQSICLPKHTNTLDSAVNKTEKVFIDEENE